MSTVRVALDMSEGEAVVIAHPTPVPGLVIHAAVNQPGDWWAITHAGSGGAVSSYLPSPEAALGCAVDLGRLADWTQPLAVLHRTVPGVEAVLGRWGAGTAPARQVKVPA